MKNHNLIKYGKYLAVFAAMLTAFAGFSFAQNGNSQSIAVTLSAEQPSCAVGLNSSSINFGTLIVGSTSKPYGVSISESSSQTIGTEIFLQQGGWTGQDLNGQGQNIPQILFASAATNQTSSTLGSQNLMDSGVYVAPGSSNDLYFSAQIPSSMSPAILGSYSTSVTISSEC